MGKELLRTGLLKKDPFLSSFVPSTMRDIAAAETTNAVPEKETLPKDIFMSIVRAERVAAPIPGRNRFLSSEKTSVVRPTDLYISKSKDGHALHRFH